MDDDEGLPPEMTEIERRLWHEIQSLRLRSQALEVKHGRLEELVSGLIQRIMVLESKLEAIREALTDEEG